MTNYSFVVITELLANVVCNVAILFIRILVLSQYLGQVLYL